MAFSGAYAVATASNPSSALTDFSFSVDLSTMPASWWAEVNTTVGAKGRAAKDDGSTELATDWLSFDSVAETGCVRIKYTGALASSGTQKVRLYPPKAANTTYAADDTYGSENAYDSSWKGYWPLDEDDAGTWADRTSNGNDGTETGTVTEATGKICGGAEFDNNGTDGIGMAYDSSLAITGDLSLFAWVKMDTLSSSSEDYSIIGHITSGEAESENALYTMWIKQGKVRYIHEANAGDNELTEWDPGLSAGTWYHLGIVRDDTAKTVTLYVNGSAVGSTFNYSDSATGGGDGHCELGLNEAYGGAPSLDGVMDEAQVQSAARSAAWAKHEYDQTNDNGTFWGTWSFESAAAEGGPTLCMAPRRFSVGGFSRSFDRTFSRGLSRGASLFRRLLAQCTILQPTTVTRSGSYISPLTGKTIGANERDYVVRGGVPIDFVVGAAENLVPADFSAWDVRAGTATYSITDDEGVFTEVDGGGALTHFVIGEFAATTAPCFVCDVKPLGRSKMGVQCVTTAPTYETIELDLEAITDGVIVQSQLTVSWKVLSGGWLRITASSTRSGVVKWNLFAATDDGYSYEGDGREAFATRQLRATSASTPMPAFAPGSAAGATYGNTVPAVTGVSWADHDHLITGVRPYYYDGADNPSGSEGRILEDDNLRTLIETGDITYTRDGAGVLEKIDSGVTIDADRADTLVEFWNGAYLELQVNDADPSSVPSLFTPDGTLYIGNSAAGALPINGIVVPPILPPKSFTDGQVEELRLGVATALAGIEF